MMRVGIVGVSGYSGLTAFELLLNHPQVRVTYATSRNSQGPLAEIWPRLKGRTNLICEKFKLDKALKLGDLFFLSLPHGASMGIVPKLLKARKRVIDLSADYRLKNALDYKKWYDLKHTDAGHLSQAVYGLPELYRSDIKKANLVANPGCYSTAAILALAPLCATHTDTISSIIIDAKSGVSGAGRKLADQLMFCEVHENFKAYKVLNHQHTPEINLYLSKLARGKINVIFVPHLLPVNRGIWETIYVRFKNRIQEKMIFNLYQKFYKTEPFIRLVPLGSQPQLRDVVGTNYCDIGFVVGERENILVISCVIDNLMKGAAGQAVQNMNIMGGFTETQGLL